LSEFVAILSVSGHSSSVFGSLDDIIIQCSLDGLRGLLAEVAIRPIGSAAVAEADDVPLPGGDCDFADDAILLHAEQPLELLDRP
jgi:hypothetical protein